MIGRLIPLPLSRFGLARHPFAARLLAGLLPDFWRFFF